jgi:hypothetical protein
VQPVSAILSVGARGAEGSAGDWFLEKIELWPTGLPPHRQETKLLFNLLPPMGFDRVAAGLWPSLGQRQVRPLWLRCTS